MFTPESYIDAVQSGKKMLVNTCVQHEGIRSALNNFIDGQTAYTKSALKVSTEVGTRLTEETVEAINQSTHFDLSKFFKIGKTVA
jgi:hypothetical protein